MPSPQPADEHVRRRMERQRTADTKPEIALRRELHGRGLRYRLDVPIVPGHPRRRVDIVFRRAKVAVFVDGCFWHQCPEHGNLPANNRGWWRTKLHRNVERDCETNNLLRREGWKVIRVWEHEEPSAAADRVEAAVRGPDWSRPTRSSAQT